VSIAAIVRALVAAGATPEMILAAVEAAEGSQQDAIAARRANDAERARRYRDRHVTSRDVTVTDVTDELVSPAPLPVFFKSSEPSQKDPKGSQKGSRQTSDADFDAFWSAYPRREGSDPKQPALKYFRQAVRGGTDPQTIIIAAQHFRSSQLGKDARFIPQARTWLKEARWEDSAPRLAVVPTATSPPRQRLTPEEVEAQVRAFGIIK
jgi:hypothetical protein